MGFGEKLRVAWKSGLAQGMARNKKLQGACERQGVDPDAVAKAMTKHLMGEPLTPEERNLLAGPTNVIDEMRQG
jgi:hypothetical protein